MSFTEHLVVLPIVLPLVAAGLMLLLDGRLLAAALNVASTVALLVVALYLLDLTSHEQNAAVRVYLLGDWPATFGIVLVADRLSALMLVLTAILACAALLFALARWHSAGSYFHPLFQIQLMGLNGAFLTGDLFNLFVFFEVLLAASYGLALHGSGPARVKAGLHYIAINLGASLVFLIGASLIYGTAGTLNLADLASRIPQLAPQDRTLFEIGAGMLGVVFLVKAAMWPLGFWLPSTYAAASAPVGALFSIMTKVGIYAVLRVGLLLTDPGTGIVKSPLFGNGWLLAGGVATTLFGMIGMLASQDMPRLAAFSVLVSSGTLLAVIGAGDAGVTGGALLYLVSSTLAIGAFFLLIELVERGRAPIDDVLAVTAEAYGLTDEDEFDGGEDAGVAVPAVMAVLGVGFIACALLLSGLPPLSGFIAKFAIMSLLLDPTRLPSGAQISATTWVLLATLLLSGLATVIAMTRAGIRSFWAPVEREVPRVRVIEAAPIAVLILLCVGLTVQAGDALRYMQATADELHAPTTYVRSVLSATPRAEPAREERKP